jgi:hypothetical protein
LAQPAIAIAAATTAANLAQRTMFIAYIPVPPFFRRSRMRPGLSAPSLSEGSVNLDEGLRRPLDPEDSPERFCNG